MTVVPTENILLLDLIKPLALPCLSENEPVLSALRIMLSQSGPDYLLVDAASDGPLLLSRRSLLDYLESAPDLETPVAVLPLFSCYRLSDSVTLAEAKLLFDRERLEVALISEAQGTALGLITRQQLFTPEAAYEIDDIEKFLRIAPSPALVVDCEMGRVVYGNPRAASQLGYDPATMNGMEVREFYKDQEQRERLRVALFRDGHVYDQEVEIYDFSGRVVWAFVSACLFSCRGTPSILLAINNISRQKQAAESLDEERSWLRTLIHTVPDLVWAKDLDGRYVICNQVMERLFGMPESEILGKNDQDFFEAHIAISHQIDDLSALESGRPLIREEKLRFAEEDDQTLFQMIKKSILAPDGTPLGVVGIGRDITDVRRNEDALKERVKELDCLYSVFSVTENLEDNLDDMLVQIVELIPRGWQQPEMTGARICWGDKEFVSEYFFESPWSLESTAETFEGDRLALTISLGAPAAGGRVSFHDEEVRLAERLVRRICETVDRFHDAQVLEEQQQLLAAMYSQTTDSIMLVDFEDSRLVDFNYAAHYSLGYSREEFTELPIKDLLVNTTAEEARGVAQKAFDEGYCFLETQHRHKNGTIMDVEVTLRPIYLGSRQLISLVWRDVTEQKKRVEGLQLKSALFQRYNDYLGQIARHETAIDADVSGFLTLVTDSLANSFEIGRVAVWLVSQETGELRSVACCSRDSESCSCVGHETFVTEMARLREYTYLVAGQPNGPQVSDRFVSDYLNKNGIAAALYTSIISAGEFRGVLAFAQTDAEIFFSEENIVFGRQVADQIGMVLLNSARNESVKALQTSETFLKRAQVVAQLGHWYFNLEKQSFSLSEEACRICRRSYGEDLAVEEFFRLVHPDDRARVETLWKQVLNGETLNSVFRLFEVEPKWVSVRNEFEYGPAGELVAALGTIQDITEKVAVEEELRAYREQLEELVQQRTSALEAVNLEQQGIFNAANVGIVLIEERTIVRCNRKLEELFGYEPGEMLNRTTRDWYASDEEFERIGGEISLNFKTTGEDWRESQLCRKDGSVFWARMAARPLAGTRGTTVPRLVGIVEDISAEREVAESLRLAVDAAEAASRTKSAFLANISHEIRTPLNSILGISHLMSETLSEPAHLDYLHKIEAAGLQLLDMFRDLLDLSRIESDQLILTSSEFDVEQLILSNINRLAEQIRAKRLNLVVDISPELSAPLSADTKRIGQILYQYLANAVKFTDSGSITIEACLSHADAGTLLVLSVTDTGCGIADDQLGHLFQSFHQADMSSTRRFGGTGLGLAICRKLAHLMGGDVGVESAEGRGSRFWFSARIELFAEKPAVDRLRLFDRVLTVCAASSEGRIMNRVIGETAAQVDTLPSLEAAVARLKGFTASAYDVIAVDYSSSLDGLGGLDELSRTVAEGYRRIILVAPFWDELLREKAQALGIGLVVNKPLTRTRWREAAEEFTERLQTLSLPEIQGVEPAPEETRGVGDDAQRAEMSAEGAPRLPETMDNIDLPTGLYRVMGKVELLESLLRKFLENHRGAADKIHLVLLAGNVDNAVKLVHSLKSVAGNIGALRFQKALERLESVAKQGANPAQLQAAFESCRVALLDLIDELDQVFSARQQEAPFASAETELSSDQLYDEFVLRLKDDDLQAVDLFHRHEKLFAELLGSRFLDVKVALERYSFETVLDYLEGRSAGGSR